MRCDRCGARAYARIEQGGRLVFAFCGHHTREHLPKLKELGYEVVVLEPAPAPV